MQPWARVAYLGSPRNFLRATERHALQQILSFAYLCVLRAFAVNPLLDVQSA